MLKIKIIEYWEDWWIIQETHNNNVIDHQIGRIDSREYTAKQLINLLITLESEAQPYIKEFNKKNKWEIKHH